MDKEKLRKKSRPDFGSLALEGGGITNGWV